MTMVITFSKYNRKMMAGWFALAGKKISETMTCAEVLAFLAKHYHDMPIDCRYV